MTQRAALARTKIVATIGPACGSLETVERMVEAGADAFRLNFSHGTHDDHARFLGLVREVERRRGQPLAILQDLCGPKIRLGQLGSEGLHLREGERVRLVARASAGEGELPCDFPGLASALSVGQPILLADGAVGLRVESLEAAGPMLLVEQGGVVRTKQGLNLPDTALDTPALTAKDLADFEWGAAHGVDWVALSFVRTADDVNLLRRERERLGSNAAIVAKIEKPQALGNLDAILAASDAVMVARGDLGVEIDVARVPAMQKRILAACRAAGVPAITATQMLASMETSSRPTRAEASDVFNAVLDGSDAVMLSGETAAGAHPVAAVATMNRIVTEAERELASAAATAAASGLPAAERRFGVTRVTAAIVEAARVAADRLDAALIVVATRSGRTAVALSRLRPRTPTLALSSDEGVARKLGLLWGVTALHVDDAADTSQVLARASAWASAQGLIPPGGRARIVLVEGTNPGSAVHDGLIVREIG